MRHILAFFATIFAAFVAVAGNYPDRSDFLWITEPDHADWLYRTGEQAAIELESQRQDRP